MELRDSKGRFMPGNPSKGSRPKKIPEELREAFKELVPRSVEVIAEILNNRKTKSNVRLEAVKVVLDRVYGKPAQAQDITLDVSGSLDLTAQIRRVLLESEDDRYGIEGTD
ncbi:MAG: hypothetical protein IJG37_01185 [Synergistaceae bacterium]|nr:hypothetical protein [Synergistaceae bacterium]MBQ3446242.1 hypothetical protein [Synergistaceae bacterium]MBQ6665896.1 hypothetical protein [Synergistaceae bacterium]